VGYRQNCIDWWDTAFRSEQIRRRGHYELGIDARRGLKLPVAFDKLARVI